MKVRSIITELGTNIIDVVELRECKRETDEKSFTFTAQLWVNGIHAANVGNESGDVVLNILPDIPESMFRHLKKVLSNTSIVKQLNSESWTIKGLVDHMARRILHFPHRIVDSPNIEFKLID